MYRKETLKLLQALNDEKQSAINDSLNDESVKQWINTKCWLKDITKPRLVCSDDTKYGTCLCFAARANDASIVRQLVQSGSDVTITDSDGLTPLHHACVTERDVKEKVAFLLGCDPSLVHICTVIFNTPLQLAALTGNADVISILIQHGADINSRGEHGRTPLHAASFYGHVACIDELVRLGADVEARDSEREATPLMLAAFHNHAASVDALINKHGASINAVENYGVTALHLAACSGHIDVVKTLSSDLRCRYNARDTRGRTALDKAKSNGHTAVVKLLQDSEETASQYTAYTRQRNPVKTMSSDSNKGRTSAKEKGLAVVGFLKKIVSLNKASEEPASDGSKPETGGTAPVADASASMESRVTDVTSSVAAVRVSSAEQSFGKTRHHARPTGIFQNDYGPH